MPRTRQLVYALPKMSYTGTVRKVVWNALRLAGARKAGTMAQTHLCLHRASALFLGPRAPAGEQEAWERVQTVRRAMLLVDKALYAETAEEIAQLRELARALAPRLYDAWRAHGFAAHNFRAWQNLFDVDLVVLQDAHVLLGGAIDKFHQHFKRGAPREGPG